ncbi:MAG: hypothetical protein GY845_25915 [Planctomycetes bacterium]|nr:hypothetical protein [Planctomycetota bacterium]
MEIAINKYSLRAIKATGYENEENYDIIDVDEITADELVAADKVRIKNGKLHSYSVKVKDKADPALEKLIESVKKKSPEVLDLLKYLGII